MEVKPNYSYGKYVFIIIGNLKHPERSYINLKKQVFIAKNILNTDQHYSNRVGRISQKIFVLK